MSILLVVWLFLEVIAIRLNSIPKINVEVADQLRIVFRKDANHKLNIFVASHIDGMLADRGTSPLLQQVEAIRSYSRPSESQQQWEDWPKLFFLTLKGVRLGTHGRGYVAGYGNQSTSYAAHHWEWDIPDAFHCNS